MIASAHCGDACACTLLLPLRRAITRAAAGAVQRARPCRQALQPATGGDGVGGGGSQNARRALPEWAAQLHAHRRSACCCCICCCGGCADGGASRQQQQPGRHRGGSVAAAARRRRRTAAIAAVRRHRGFARAQRAEIRRHPRAFVAAWGAGGRGRPSLTGARAPISTALRLFSPLVAFLLSLPLTMSRSSALQHAAALLLVGLALASAPAAAVSSISPWTTGGVLTFYGGAPDGAFAS